MDRLTDCESETFDDLIAVRYTYARDPPLTMSHSKSWPEGISAVKQACIRVHDLLRLIMRLMPGANIDAPFGHL